MTMTMKESTLLVAWMRQSVCNLDCLIGILQPQQTKILKWSIALTLVQWILMIALSTPLVSLACPRLETPGSGIKSQ